jgi:hypothetical protein
MPRSGIAGSYGNSIFSFLRSLHTVYKVVTIVISQYYKCSTTFSPIFAVSHALDESHSNKNEVGFFFLRSFVALALLFRYILYFFKFYYSYVHTRLGSFLPPAPTPSLTTHSTPSLSPPPSQYPAETILPLFLILL